MNYKSKDVTRLTGIPAATLRDWRSQGKDFEGEWGAEKTKDHLYSKRGLLSLAIMKSVRAAGGTLDEAWSVAFWAVGELAKHLNIRGMESWGNGAGGAYDIQTTKAEWVFISDSNPVVTDNPANLTLLVGQPGDASVIRAVSLRQIARDLSPELVEEVGGRKVGI